MKSTAYVWLQQVMLHGSTKPLDPWGCGAVSVVVLGYASTLICWYREDSEGQGTSSSLALRRRVRASVCWWPSVPGGGRAQHLLRNWEFAPVSQRPDFPVVLGVLAVVTEFDFAGVYYRRPEPLKGRVLTQL